MALPRYGSEIEDVIRVIGMDAFTVYMKKGIPPNEIPKRVLPKITYGSTPTIKGTDMSTYIDTFTRAARSMEFYSGTWDQAKRIHIGKDGKVTNKRKPKKRPREVQPMKHTTVLKFWLETTRQVLTGIPNKVAGGYPRDLHFGVEPKDVDFFVRYNEKTVNEILSRLKQLNLPHHDCIDDIEDEEGYPSDETEDRISRVIKVGEYIDIIFVNHALTKVTDNFDFNINQFELGMMDDPVFTGKTHNNVLQVVTDTSLYNKKEELSSDRISKIVKKADSLGWVCSQEVLDIVAKI